MVAPMSRLTQGLCACRLPAGIIPHRGFHNLLNMKERLSTDESGRDTRPRQAVTIRDIAKVCGVGKTAVAAAIYGGGRVGEQKRLEILKVARELGYEPARQAVARRLAMQRSQHEVVNHVIALFTYLLDISQGAHERDTFRGVADVCANARFAILLTETLHAKSAKDLPYAFSRGDADGAIFVGAQDELLKMLRDVAGFDRRPIVSLFRRIPGCSSVISDDREGTRAAVNHLLSEGHRHFLTAYLSSGMTSRRIAGIRDAFEERGVTLSAHYENLELPPALLNPATAPHVLPLDGAPGMDVTIGASILLPYLREHTEITALLCENDAMALHVWHMLHNAGLRVPGDISLIGFDDTDGMVDGGGANHLSTIRRPLREMGRAAAEMLIKRIYGELTEDTVRVLPVEFIVRKSTGVPGLR